MVVAGGLDAGTVGERFVTLETAVGAPLINPLAPPVPPAPVLAAPVTPGAVAFTRPLPRKLKLSRSTVKVKLRCTGGPCSDKLVLKQWHTTLASGTSRPPTARRSRSSLKLKRKPKKRTTSVSLELAQQKLDAVRIAARTLKRLKYLSHGCGGAGSRRRRCCSRSVAGERPLHRSRRRSR